MLRYITVLILLCSMASCRPKVLPPKPKGYFRIDTPATHQYQVFDKPGFPYSFEYPVYSVIGRDTANDAGAGEHRYWINISFPTLGGVINLTYKEINAKQPLMDLLNDANELSFLHHRKTNSELGGQAYNTGEASGVLYILDGDVASKYQFTATDSFHHFIHGSLYFEVTPNADSLLPATDFLVQDIQHMLLTLKWKKPNG